VSYVTVPDYEAWAGPIADGEGVARAQVALDAACEAVREYTCQAIDLVTDDEIGVVGSGTQYLLLPQLPVAEVASITDEDAAAVDDWSLRDSGIVYRAEGWRAGHLYTVTYTHGWAPEDVPGDIKMATFQLAHGFTSSLSGQVQQESIGGYSVSYARGENTSPLASIDRRIIKRVPVP
jgi:hypothetical protein